MKETLLTVYASMAGLVISLGLATVADDDEEWKRLPPERRTRARMVRLTVGLLWPVAVASLVGWGVYRVARAIGRWIAWEVAGVFPRVQASPAAPQAAPAPPSPDLGPHRTPRPPGCPKCGRAL